MLLGSTAMGIHTSALTPTTPMLHATPNVAWIGASTAVVELTRVTGPHELFSTALDCAAKWNGYVSVGMIPVGSDVKNTSDEVNDHNY